MIVSTNIKQHNLLPSYEFLDASVVGSLNRFQIQRYRNAILNLEKEERNVHGYKKYFYNLSAKGWFQFTHGICLLVSLVSLGMNQDLNL